MLRASLHSNQRYPMWNTGVGSCPLGIAQYYNYGPFSWNRNQWAKGLYQVMFQILSTHTVNGEFWTNSEQLHFMGNLIEIRARYQWTSTELKSAVSNNPLALTQNKRNHWWNLKVILGKQFGSTVVETERKECIRCVEVVGCEFDNRLGNYFGHNLSVEICGIFNETKISWWWFVCCICCNLMKGHFHFSCEFKKNSIPKAVLLVKLR